MTNERTTILVDKEKVSKLTELGFSLSAVCRAAIEQALDISSEDIIFDMRLRKVEDELLEQQGKELDLSLSLDYCRNRVKYLKEERERIKSSAIKAIEVAKYSAVANKINRIILAAYYDHAAIIQALNTDDGKIILKEMMDINPSFDLTKHIANLKQVMED